MARSYIYMYQMDCVCQHFHKECSTRTCPDDCHNWWKSPNSSHLYDHGFMDVITTPIVRQSKIDFMHKQVIRPLLHGGSHFWLPDDWCSNYIHETMVVQMTWVWTFSTIIYICIYMGLTLDGLLRQSLIMNFYSCIICLRRKFKSWIWSHMADQYELFSLHIFHCSLMGTLHDP